MYKNIQEISRFLQKALDSSHVFHHSVEMCGLLQASLKPSTLFPLMAKCRSPQKPLGLYISPQGRSFEASCDTQLLNTPSFQIEELGQKHRTNALVLQVQGTQVGFKERQWTRLISRKILNFYWLPTCILHSPCFFKILWKNVKQENTHKKEKEKVEGNENFKNIFNSNKKNLYLNFHI